MLTQDIRSLISQYVSFRVNTKSLSRLINISGAENLKSPGYALVSWNGPFVECKMMYEMKEKIDSVWKELSVERMPSTNMINDKFFTIQETPNSNNSNVNSNLLNHDPLVNEIKKFAMDGNQVSTSSIQRRYGVGYTRAAHLIDLIHENKAKKDTVDRISSPIQENTQKDNDDLFHDKIVRTMHLPINVVKHKGEDATVWLENGDLYIDIFKEASVPDALRKLLKPWQKLQALHAHIHLEAIKEVYIKRPSLLGNGYLRFSTHAETFDTNLNGIVLHNIDIDFFVHFNKIKEKEFISFSHEVSDYSNQAISLKKQFS